jgi:hypothetical protein
VSTFATAISFCNLVLAAASAVASAASATAAAAAFHYLSTVCRRLVGLPPAISFRNITPDAELAAKLEQLYGGNVNNIDAYVGGIAEPHHGNAHVGQLFYVSILDQFKRLRDGDWYYYKNGGNGLFNAQQIAEIDSTGGQSKGVDS